MANLIKSVRLDENFISRLEEIGGGNFSKGLDYVLKDYFMIDSNFNKKKDELLSQEYRFKEIESCIYELSKTASVIKGRYY